MAWSVKPPSVGVPRNPERAFWYDAVVRIEGLPMMEVQKPFFHSWQRQAGNSVPQASDFPLPPHAGNGIIRTDGGAARNRKLLSAVFFVPTYRQWRLLDQSAQRGVKMDLILAGYSDLPICVRAARTLDVCLIRYGVSTHELRDGDLHCKVTTIEGPWTAIGCSNLDRRSFLNNTEVDQLYWAAQPPGRW